MNISADLGKYNLFQWHLTGTPRISRFDVDMRASKQSNQLVQNMEIAVGKYTGKLSNKMTRLNLLIFFNFQ